MRRRAIYRRHGACLVFQLQYVLAKLGQLAGQLIDLPPLHGDGFIEFLDDLILMCQMHFERINSFTRRFFSAHVIGTILD